MYGLLTFVQYLAYLAMIVLAAALVLPALATRREAARLQARKRRVGEAPTMEDEGEEVVSARAAQQANLKFLGLPSIHAGQHVLNVPTLNLGHEAAWERRHMVITTSRITALLKQGAVPGDLIELGSGYALLGSNGKTFLLQSHLLTTTEEDALEKERDEAVRKGEPIIPNFQGFQWKIGTACGSHTPRQTSGKRQSTIQTLSAHPRLGQDELISCLPPNLLDGKEHDYYDMRARVLGGDNRVLLFFFAGGKWNCFMGRELDETERDRLQAI